GARARVGGCAHRLERRRRTVRDGRARDPAHGRPWWRRLGLPDSGDRDSGVRERHHRGRKPDARRQVLRRRDRLASRPAAPRAMADQPRAQELASARETQTNITALAQPPARVDCEPFRPSAKNALPVNFALATLENERKTEPACSRIPISNPSGARSAGDAHARAKHPRLKTVRRSHDSRGTEPAHRRVCSSITPPRRWIATDSAGPWTP